MRILLAVVLTIFTSSSYALGGYKSLPDNEQKLLSQVQKVLGFNDPSDKVKLNIYNNISWIFEGNWNSRWFDLTELSASKLKSSTKSHFFELSVNNEKNGIIFVTFVYKPKVHQVTIISREIRHGSSSDALSHFKKSKNKKEYKVDYEHDKTALLHQKGRVSYDFYNVYDNTASVVYFNMTVINTK